MKNAKILDACCGGKKFGREDLERKYPLKDLVGMKNLCEKLKSKAEKISGVFLENIDNYKLDTVCNYFGINI